jgi:hypothetical protein
MDFIAPITQGPRAKGLPIRLMVDKSLRSKAWSGNRASELFWSSDIFVSVLRSQYISVGFRLGHLLTHVDKHSSTAADATK